MLAFHAIGDWLPTQVRVENVPSTRRTTPAIDALIDEAWNEVLRRPGVKLFDGPMCRMESWNARPELLEISLSQISYKPFMGTNLAHPELADRFGREVMANPVGVSSALETADGYLLLGRRNGSVAYYPHRTHPFAGALEPSDGGDLFAAVRRELNEELSIEAKDLGEMRCTGIAEDLALRQPELLFRVCTTLSRSQVESQVQREEHGDSVAVAAKPGELAQFLSDQQLTPVAVASLLLWGRVRIGEEWFAENSGKLAP
jgi:8-oxo-dGTP pyrophosphatase MutT (NUDIX family)